MQRLMPSPRGQKSQYSESITWFAASAVVPSATAESVMLSPMYTRAHSATIIGAANLISARTSPLVGRLNSTSSPLSERIFFRHSARSTMAFAYSAPVVAHAAPAAPICIGPTSSRSASRLTLATMGTASSGVCVSLDATKPACSTIVSSAAG